MLGITKTAISKNISEIKTNNDTVRFTVDLSTRESIRKLILKENVITAEIPQLNGYSPSKVTTSGEYTYDEKTRTLTASRASTVNEEGIVTKTLSRENTYTINIEYPKEAYKETANTISLEIPVTTYYVGYNNSNKEFENPKQSNIAKDVVVLRYSKPSGYVYNFDITVGKYGRNGYAISKEKPLQIYNGITEETVEDYYTVKWELTRGSQGDVTKVVMKETPNEYTDKFLNTSREYTSMLDYIENIGIYFAGASSCLGDNGFIKVYNDETNELIHTFNKNDWGKYTDSNPYKYESGIKHIRIETSSAKQGSSFNVYHIKEINDELLTEKISKQDFDEFSKIYSYLQGSVQIEGKSSMDSMSKIGIANYESKVSYANIGINKGQISTQETQENFEIYINTVATSFNDSKWKNGQFIVKLPNEIIASNINDVKIDNANVQIVGYDVYEENGNYFIKIISENEEEETYKITINCDITPDPGAKTMSRSFELYSYNEIGENYYNPVQDIYDANGNNNLEEKVNYSLTNLSFITPSTIITSQYASDYDNEDAITISPNIANVAKEQRTANINVTLLNNYSNTISEVKLIGVIPSEGNSYIVNGKDLGSEFTVQMSNSGIKLPDELKDVVTVYYSENSKPNKELEDSSNGWTKTPSDWTKVKTYLIDFGDFNLPISKSYTFTYEVQIPEGIDYNKVSYSEHAVYFALDTEQGKLLTQTEPNKLGIRIARKYNIELTKYKEGKNLVVPGAIYKLIGKAENGNEVTSKLGTTNLDGKLQIKNILIGKKYTLKEIKAADNYNLNEDEITFEVIENTDGDLEVNILSEDTFGNTPIIEKDANGKDVLKANVEDEPKYKVVITKTDKKTGEKLKNIKFTFNGVIYITDVNGQIVLEKLEANKEYSLKETRANGYYILDEIKFKLVKDSQGNLSIESENTNFSNAVIENTDKEHVIKVNVNLTNEKIPTYNLQILKVKEDSNQENIEKLEPLQGAVFRLHGEDLDYQKDYTTDKNGNIDILDLYQFVEGKSITGNYTLQEIKAPNGYANCAEEIKFRVVTNDEDNLEIQIVDKDNLKTIKNIQSNGNTIKLVIEDKPLFKLVKTDKETGELLANARFVIYEIEETGKVIDYAKDVNGNYVGEKDKYGQYVVTTDENGTITLSLRGGLYRISEIGFPEGYEEFAEDEFFRIIGGTIEDVVVDPEEPTEEKQIIEINSIEDLVDLSNAVNSGDTYSNKIVKLMRTLDFEDNASYKNINDNSYGDLNRDGTIEGIKAELTDKVDGCGFIPIGKFYDTPFSGIFDGQEKEIKNLYINIYKEDIENTKVKSLGIFGTVKNGTIQNLGVTGNISSNDSKYSRIGGIVGYITYSRVINCYSKTNINVNSGDTCHVGGIVGDLYNGGVIINSYNTGNISGVLGDSKYTGVGGIAGSIQSAYVGNSYNTGNVRLNIDNVSGSVGEIVGRISDKDIIQNSYHLDSIEIIGNNKTKCSEPKTEEFMKTEEFINLLGINNWKLDENNANFGYPILMKSKVEKISNINSIEDLVRLSQQVNNGETYNGERVILTKNLDFEDDSSYINPSDKSFGDINKDGIIEGIKSELTDKEDGCGFTPIGKGYGYKFSGELDGQGYKIENLYIKQKAENDEHIGTYVSEYIGLFGYLENATINNLTVTGNINEQEKCGNHTTYRGGIVAYAIDSKITNCNNMIDIKDNDKTHENYIGGIIGYADNCIINNNTNGGNISFKSVQYDNNVGGIVGYAQNSSITNNSNISTIYVYSNYHSAVGGIAGEVYKTKIDNCYNLDSIETSWKSAWNNTTFASVGGIIGSDNDSSISNCYNKGYIRGTSSGGIVGGKDGGALNNCYNTGDVSRKKLFRWYCRKYRWW